MHCVDCGTQNLDSTRYCKSCGANLEVVRQALTQNHSSAPVSLVGPKHVGLILILATFAGIFGMGIVFGFIVTLAKTIGAALGNGLLPLLMILGLFGVTGVCLIVLSLLRMLRVPAAPKHTGPLSPVVNAALDAPPQGHALPSYREGVPSVVEHTTARLANYAPPDREDPHRS